MEEAIHIFADIETDTIQASLLLQIGAVSEDNHSFTVYINPKQILPLHCTNLTGLYYYKGELYKNGRCLNSVSITKALRKFVFWLQEQKRPVVLVFHNGWGFDCCKLITFFLRFNIALPTNIVAISDTLPLFRNHLKETEIPNHKLQTLAKHFNISIVSLHDAYFDSKILKEVCEKYSFEKQISLKEFLKEYQKPFQFFVNKVKERNQNV